MRESRGRQGRGQGAEDGGRKIRLKDKASSHTLVATLTEPISQFYMSPNLTLCRRKIRLPPKIICPTRNLLNLFHLVNRHPF